MILKRKLGLLELEQRIAPSVTTITLDAANPTYSYTENFGGTLGDVVTLAFDDGSSTGSVDVGLHYDGTNTNDYITTIVFDSSCTEDSTFRALVTGGGSNPDADGIIDKVQEVDFDAPDAMGTIEIEGNLDANGAGDVAAVHGNHIEHLIVRSAQSGDGTNDISDRSVGGNITMDEDQPAIYIFDGLDRHDDIAVYGAINGGAETDVGIRIDGYAEGTISLGDMTDHVIYVEANSGSGYIDDLTVNVGYLPTDEMDLAAASLSVMDGNNVQSAINDTVDAQTLDGNLGGVWADDSITDTHINVGGNLDATGLYKGFPVDGFEPLVLVSDADFDDSGIFEHVTIDLPNGGNIYGGIAQYGTGDDFDIGVTIHTHGGNVDASSVADEMLYYSNENVSLWIDTGSGGLVGGGLGFDGGGPFGNVIGNVEAENDVDLLIINQGDVIFTPGDCGHEGGQNVFEYDGAIDADNAVNFVYIGGDFGGSLDSEGDVGVFYVDGTIYDTNPLFDDVVFHADGNVDFFKAFGVGEDAVIEADSFHNIIIGDGGMDAVFGGFVADNGSGTIDNVTIEGIHPDGATLAAMFDEADTDDTFFKISDTIIFGPEGHTFFTDGGSVKVTPNSGTVEVTYFHSDFVDGPVNGIHEILYNSGNSGDLTVIGKNVEGFTIDNVCVSDAIWPQGFGDLTFKNVDVGIICATGNIDDIKVTNGDLYNVVTGAGEMDSIFTLGNKIGPSWKDFGNLDNINVTRGDLGSYDPEDFVNYSENDTLYDIFHTLEHKHFLYGQGWNGEVDVPNALTGKIIADDIYANINLGTADHAGKFAKVEARGDFSGFLGVYGKLDSLKANYIYGKIQIGDEYMDSSVKTITAKYEFDAHLKGYGSLGTLSTGDMYGNIKFHGNVDKITASGDDWDADIKIYGNLKNLTADKVTSMDSHIKIHGILGTFSMKKASFDSPGTVRADALTNYFDMAGVNTSYTPGPPTIAGYAGGGTLTVNSYVPDSKIK